MNPQEQNLFMNRKNMKIGFIGLGKLGLECAEAMVQKNIEVHGYDIVEKYSNSVIIHDNIKDAIEEKKFIFIAVETPHDVKYDGSKPSSHLEPKDFDYDRVIDVINSVNAYISENQTISTLLYYGKFIVKEVTIVP